MNQRQKIEERLRRKESEVQSLEAKLRAAKVYAGALRDVLAMMGRESRSQTGGSANVHVGAGAVLRQGSAVARAREAMLQHRAPMHIDDLLTVLGKENTRVNKASLTGSLAAYVRRNEIFSRTAPNTYGLLELGHDSLTESNRPASPPEGFGGSGGDSGVSAPGDNILDDDDEIPF